MFFDTWKTRSPWRTDSSQPWNRAHIRTPMQLPSWEGRQTHYSGHQSSRLTLRKRSMSLSVLNSLPSFYWLISLFRLREDQLIPSSTLH
jgi:hypothetical protein